MIAKVLLWLDTLRSAFSRTKTHSWFCIVILSLMLQTRPKGTVQSYLNTLGIAPKYYTNLDDLFRSDAVNLKRLTDLWVNIIENECTAFRFRGRRVFVTDGVKMPKEGRRMPGVKRLHNDSDTQSKPSSFHGVQAAGIVTLMHHPLSKSEVLSMPIELRLMDGLEPVATWENTSHPYATEPLEMQSFHRLEHYIKQAGDSYIVADRASMNKELFAECDAIHDRTGANVHMITNAKSNVVAYEQPIYKGRGRKPVRGKKVALTTLFQEKHSEFRRARVYLYGKHQTVHYYSTKLLWGAKTRIPLLFVLCVMEEDGRRIILATNDTNMKPLEVIRLYSLRFGSIEEDFKVLKNEFGGMSFRFWTRSMPHLSHFRPKDAPHILDSVTSEHDRKYVLDAIRATEFYMQSSFIALGMAKLLAAKEPTGGAIQRFTQKRTYTPRKVSEADICSFLRAHQDIILCKYQDHPIMKFLTARLHADQFLHDVI